MNQLFSLEKTCPDTGARAGILTTSHGSILTPTFMPVGSQGTVKAMTPHDLESLGVGMVLANTYHLYLRPGIEVISKLGGLHKFMSWHGPILTDSGGFQVFSLGHLSRINDEGVLFRSHIDGSEHFLTPEYTTKIQEELGADIIMVFDECPPYVENFQNIRQAMERSHVWAERCRRVHSREGQALFGIVHGGTYAELRRQSATFITSLDFPGYAIGGLSLGEPKALMHSMLDDIMPMLPGNKPRYLMGVGSPEDLVECVARGVDMFDSALPTRLARNGALFTSTRRYSVGNARFKLDAMPIDTDCDCYTCRNFSAAYLHHLFKSEELLAYHLATVHNLRFITRLMEQIRQSILDGTFVSFKESFLSRYQPTNAVVRAEQKQKWLESRQSNNSPD
ncbi:MAG: tRNA guanosine(34) transglycosylase Tgt [Chloroflexota bacterium]|nr:tRNA guanosine(34) transglycosylase Tgt [Chloroflexota bacterium]